MKKLICILMALTFICALAACGDGNTPDTPEVETFESKIFDGIDAVFDESLGYYNENPSAFQEERRAICTIPATPSNTIRRRTALPFA